MHHLDQILIVLGCGCVLPIMVVWFMIRESINKTTSEHKLYWQPLRRILIWTSRNS